MWFWQKCIFAFLARNAFLRGFRENALLRFWQKNAIYGYGGKIRFWKKIHFAVLRKNRFFTVLAEKNVLAFLRFCAKMHFWGVFVGKRFSWFWVVDDWLFTNSHQKHKTNIKLEKVIVNLFYYFLNCFFSSEKGKTLYIFKLDFLKIVSYNHL